MVCLADAAILPIVVTLIFVKRALAEDAERSHTFHSLIRFQWTEVYLHN